MAYSPIGIGLPLSIELLTIYTGDAPGRFLGFIGGKPSMLVASGVRSASSGKAAPKAINQLVKHIEDFQLIGPEAFSNGSPIVYYSPALTESTLLTQYHLVVDSFDEGIFKSLSTLFSAAGALPIFAPASAVLLAGAGASAIFGKLGKSLLESRPFLNNTENVRLATAGLPPTEPRPFLVYNDRDRAEFEAESDGRRKYAVQQVAGASGPTLALVEAATGERYRGRAPYLILNLDGAKRTELESFAPTLATAEMLEEFYGNQTMDNAVEIMHQAMTLFNDFEFRKKAEAAKRHLAETDEGTPEHAAELAKFEAYQANILTDLFKLPSD